jgi:hypothetical protein
VLVPSKNVTVPVGANGEIETLVNEETLAVKITDCPGTDGLALEVTVVVVLLFTITVWVPVAEDLP